MKLSRRTYVLPDLEVRRRPVVGKLGDRQIMVTEKDRRDARAFLDAKVGQPS